MSLPFLAPLFLAGAALIAIPWLIHRIRRPRREPIPFSSLLFIPQVDRQVIERRNLQHLLLMLLRMSLLLLAAIAFSRPFFSRKLPASPVEGRVSHVVLIDTSWSMSAMGWMSEAKTRAKEVVRSIPEGEPIGVIAFARNPRVLVPLLDSETGKRGDAAAANDAIDSVTVSEEGTAYLPALQRAEEMLAGGAGKSSGTTGVIHLIGDLQEEGFPQGTASTWRLGSDIRLQAIPVANEDASNRSLVDVAVRPTPDGQFRVLGKVRNWTMGDDAEIPVSLHLVNGETQTKSMKVLRHHSSQIAFEVPPTKEGEDLAGWLQIGDDGLELDNYRYFLWSPPRTIHVLLAGASGGSEGWPSDIFLREAIEGPRNLPFQLEEVAPGDVADRLEKTDHRPDVVMMGSYGGNDQRLNASLRAYLESGGGALIALEPEADAGALNASLFGGLKIHVRDSGSALDGGRRYRLLQWIDFDHPVFAPFRGPRYNDFSPIRVSRFVPMEGDAENPEAELRVKTLIKLEPSEGESDGPPALIESACGAGRLLVWTFPFEAGVTNFPKSARFAPLVVEQVRYLARAAEQRSEFFVGASVPQPSVAVLAKIADAKGKVQKVSVSREASPALVLKAAGLLNVTLPDGGTAGTRAAVNIDPTEADPARLDAESFALRVGAVPAPSQPGNPAVASSAPGAESPSSQGREFGWYFLLPLLAFLFLELWYAPRLVR